MVDGDGEVLAGEAPVAESRSYLAGKAPGAYAREGQEALEQGSFGEACEANTRSTLDLVAAENALKVFAERFVEAINSRYGEGKVRLEGCHCDHWQSEVFIRVIIGDDTFDEFAAFMSSQFGIERTHDIGNQGKGTFQRAGISFPLCDATKVFERVVGAKGLLLKVDAVEAEIHEAVGGVGNGTD